jgi:hypothetical protein
MGDGLPERLGRYRLRARLGVDSGVTSYLAGACGDGGFEGWAEVQVVHPDVAGPLGHAAMRAIFERARWLAEVRHPNVIAVLEVGRDAGVDWVACEYVYGLPLSGVLPGPRRAGVPRAPWPVAARLVADAARGLDAAHAARGEGGAPLGFAHGEIGAHSISIGRGGLAKCGLFDLSSALLESMHALSPGSVIDDRPVWTRAPERLLGLAVDRRADLFSLGALLWELTTGHRLFYETLPGAGGAHSLGWFERRERTIACEVPAPSSFVRGFPPALERALLRALARRPDDRFETAGAFADALEAPWWAEGAGPYRASFAPPRHEDVAAWAAGPLDAKLAPLGAQLRDAAAELGLRAGVSPYESAEAQPARAGA